MGISIEQSTKEYQKWIDNNSDINFSTDLMKNYIATLLNTDTKDIS